MRKIYAILSLLVIVVMQSACSKAPSHQKFTDRISLEGPQDKFLLNFVTVKDGKLMLDIDKNTAQYAGAKLSSYNNLNDQLTQINNEGNKQLIEDYRKELKELSAAALSKADHKGEYSFNMEDVPESDLFLLLFLYVRDNNVVLDISEEMALKCGATLAGYQAVRDNAPSIYAQQIESSNGLMSYKQLGEMFEEGRQNILAQGGGPFTKPTTPPTPQQTGGATSISLPITLPETYAIIRMDGGWGEQQISNFYNSQQVNATGEPSHLLGFITMERNHSGQLENLLIFTNNQTFTGSFIYPQGTSHSLTATKPVDTYDAIVGITEHRELSDKN